MLIRSRNRLRKELWYINAGILSDSAYTKACNEVSEILKQDQLFNIIIFLLVDYLVHYLELLSINPSKLLVSCIKQHLLFVEKLLAQRKTVNRYFSFHYIDAILNVCDHLENAEDCVVKQFCIDEIERISNFLTTKSRMWVQNNLSLAYLRLFDRNGRTTVVYNSFLIPNDFEYIEPLTYPNQKNLEKIENDCFCKISLFKDLSNCKIGEYNMVLEVLFDYYKGNFLGFLDNLSYLVKRINPTKYFVKSLRTVTKTESLCFTILNDLPLTELRLLDRKSGMISSIQPFLTSSPSSKTIFRIMIEDIKNVVKPYLEKLVSEQEDIEYWKRHFPNNEIIQYKEMIFKFIADFECWTLILKEWNLYKKCTNRKPKRQYMGQLSPEDLAELDKKPNIEIEKPTEENNNKNKTRSKDIESNEIESEEMELSMEKSISGQDNRSMDNSYIKHRTSRLSMQINKSMTSFVITNTVQTKLAIYFDALYDQIYGMRNDPNNFLNHALRVILRCKTEYEEGDDELEKLDRHNISIYDMLKQFYNFDLKKRSFYTNSQRKVSLLNREKMKRRQDRQLKRSQYLENRRIISDQIENATLDREEVIKSMSVSTESVNEDYDEVIPSKVDDVSEIDKNFEGLILHDDILFGDIRETKELLSHEFKKAVFAVLGHLEDDILQLFNEKRIIQLSVWREKIKDHAERFENKFPYRFKPLACDATESYKGQINPEQAEMVYSSVSTNIFISIKLLSGHDPDFDAEFSKMLKGQGIQINFLNEINKPNASIPRLVSFIDKRHDSYKKNLSHNLCVLSFDIYLICASLSTSFGNVFDHHYEDLKKIIDSSKDDIKDLFSLFEFEDKLAEARSLFKVRLLNRTKLELGILLKLSEDFRRFNELLFKSTCCKWRKDKVLRILYVSLSIYGNKKCQEPFLRKGGDRRLKKVENKGNCIITMRLTTHPVTGVLIPFVEIFYDFFKGNHFCAMDMLKMIFAEDQGSTARMVNARYLLVMPYGELWVVQDLEWLRTRASFMLAQENL